MKSKSPTKASSLDEVKVNLAEKAKTTASGNQSKLPHERDQSVHTAGTKERPKVQQASQDLKKGLVDTDARGQDGRPLGSRRST